MPPFHVFYVVHADGEECHRVGHPGTDWEDCFNPCGDRLRAEEVVKSLDKGKWRAHCGPHHVVEYGPVAAPSSPSISTFPLPEYDWPIDVVRHWIVAVAKHRPFTFDEAWRATDVAQIHKSRWKSVVSKTLYRLVKKGEIERLNPGLYVWPEGRTVKWKGEEE